MHLPSRRNANPATEFDMTLRFGNPVRLPRIEADESPIGGQGRIVSVNRIQREVRRSGQMDYFCTCLFKPAAKLIMLRLRGGEFRRVEESQFTPAVCPGGNVPSGCAGGTYQHPLKRPHHGMSVE